jgi:hypothetical protein
MGDYIKYSNDEITELNKTTTWRSSLDTTYTEKIRDNVKETSYVLHATGYCDMMNGCKYSALSADLDVKDKNARTKYNLM